MPELHRQQEEDAVSIDAMYWVWNHSQSKGAGRHVMLACANWITSDDCTVRASTADLVRFSNAARSSVIKAVDTLLKSGELQQLEEARGTRPALYRLPGAVGYVRPEGGSRGTKTGPLAAAQRSGNETASARQGSENETPESSARGPEIGPQGSENETPSGPETGPHNQYQGNHVEEEASSAAPAREISSEDKREFGSFWALYPKSKDYGKTLEQWTAAVAAGADPKQITAAAVAYAREKAGEEWRYIKFSANWLKARGYEDKYAPEPNGKPQLRAVGAPTAPREMTEEEKARALQFG
ncbi:hypothetical protein HW130_03225 [Streptomyces sp. PKU-EA00015]|uniref:hypothetical protein n=1 Tax=Streptomyces sp. PKU-EA00015 TaxID=2748326 RepID=UPI0015A4DD38|nr:hypothetical protein [Streptomyces sp. PKU-EA00015]NWF25284.1 hypothetical protein [Streptomyces sp. PKU-EA00015]